METTELKPTLIRRLHEAGFSAAASLIPTLPDAAWEDVPPRQREALTPGSTLTDMLHNGINFVASGMAAADTFRQVIRDLRDREEQAQQVLEQGSRPLALNFEADLTTDEAGWLIFRAPSPGHHSAFVIRETGAFHQAAKSAVPIRLAERKRVRIRIEEVEEAEEDSPEELEAVE